MGVSKLVIKKRRGAHLCCPLPVPTILAVMLPVAVVAIVLPVVVVATLSLAAVEEVVVLVVLVVAGSSGCG